MGAYTTQWLNEFHWSARGESAEDWLDEPKKSREKLPFPSVKIVFPTRATVQASAAGEQVRHQLGLVIRVLIVLMIQGRWDNILSKKAMGS